jgi:glycerol uptake facilitator-like aquaporin
MRSIPANIRLHRAVLGILLLNQHRTQGGLVGSYARTQCSLGVARVAGSDTTRSSVGDKAISTDSASHRLAWLSELIGTGALLFGTISAVRWFVANDSALARSVSGLPLRLAIVGSVVGVLVALLIVSPLGRRSGGHFNPAVTVSFWLMGALPAEDVAAYIAAQLVGSLSGTALGRLVWGGVIARPEVAYAVVQPRSGWSVASVFLVEAGSVVVLMGGVAFFLGRQALSSWTPLLVGVVVALLIGATGPWTGGSFNPAREFGPALLSGRTAFLSCYLAAPLAGAVLVAASYHLVRTRRVLTCQLCGS